MKIDYLKLRTNSLHTAQQYGYPVNNSLPLLDDGSVMKNTDELKGRALCLNLIVASSFNVTIKSNSLQWLKDNHVDHFLSNLEMSFLKGISTVSIEYFKNQQECLYSLGWALGLCNEIRLDQYVPIDLALKFPDIRKSEMADKIDPDVKIRSVREILEMLDLYYCIDWAIKNELIISKRSPGKLPYIVIRERRKALEWIVSDNDWDDVSLDT